jgi:ubiquitin carboxyl-terminal hydrolase L3
MMTQLVAGIKQGRVKNKIKPGMLDRGVSAETSKPTAGEGEGRTDDLYAGVRPERFFEIMESGGLPQWDHRAHVRGGFYVLINCLRSGLGLWDAVDDFLRMLDKMLATDAARTQVEGTEQRFRNTVHK